MLWGEGGGCYKGAGGEGYLKTNNISLEAP